MSKLNFTPEQRFIVALLCDLHRPPEKRELDPDFIANALYGGHDWALSWKYQGIFPDRTDSPENVKFVGDVLDMWSHIEIGWSKLDDTQKRSVNDAVPYLGTGPEFAGFDGNNEVDYMAIAQVMVNDLDRFSNFRGRSFNSHMPKVDRYHQMLERWPAIRATLHKQEMSPDQMTDLLSRD